MVLVAALGFAAVVACLVAHSEPIEVIESRLVRNGGLVSLEGKVRNSGEKSDDVKIEIQWFDSHGRAIGTETVELGRVDAQRAARFSSRPRALASAERYTIGVERGTNPYGN
ncbi:MAG: FxLYD domain-containing protein [Candidatus Binataceae bacterium]